MRNIGKREVKKQSRFALSLRVASSRCVVRDIVFEKANTLGFNADRITRLKEPGWIETKFYSSRSTGRDDVARW